MMVYFTVIILAYLLSGLSMTPVLIACWLFGVKPKNQQVFALVGWGAVTVVLTAYMIALL